MGLAHAPIMMMYMGGESWCTNKDLYAPFPDLKTGHVDHLLFDYFSRKFYDNVVNCIFLR